MKRLVLAAVLLVALGAPTHAQTPEAALTEAAAAYGRGDYATALMIWEVRAAFGSATAQFNLGVMYSEGTGTPQNYAKAIEWYTKAAEQGTGIDDTLAALTEIFRGLDKK